MASSIHRRPAKVAFRFSLHGPNRGVCQGKGQARRQSGWETWKVPVKVKGGSLPPMNIGKAPAVKGGVKYAGPPKAKVSWCSLLRKKQPWNQPFFF